MGFPYGNKTKLSCLTLGKNTSTYVGPVTQCAGAVGFLVRLWSDLVQSPASSITTTNLTLGTAIPGALGAGTKVTGAGVTGGTTIVSGSGTSAGSVYVVSASQTVSATTITFGNASTTGKITTVYFSPPTPDGTGANFSAAGVPSVSFGGIVPTAAASSGVPPQQHIVVRGTLDGSVNLASGALSPSQFGPGWPWDRMFLAVTVDNTDVTNGQTCMNVEVWPIYGSTSDSRATITDYATY